MISINDVDCERLVDVHNDCYPLTRCVKAKWNSMSEEERGHYVTTYKRQICLNAYKVLGDLYFTIKNDYDNDDLYERLWKDTTVYFVREFQKMLDEISKFPSATFLLPVDDIDPTIDLIKEEK